MVSLPSGMAVWVRDGDYAMSKLKLDGKSFLLYIFQPTAVLGKITYKMISNQKSKSHPKNRFKIKIKDHLSESDFKSKQESCAIAKMTTQCALWVHRKFQGLPDYAHGYYSPHFSRAFVRIDPLNVPTKFEVRSFIRSSDNRGYQKIGQSLDTPTIPFHQNF